MAYYIAHLLFHVWKHETWTFRKRIFLGNQERIKLNMAEVLMY